MSITNFNTSNSTFRKLMGNGLVYSVPPFQRDYSWTEQEWEDLWQDIVAMMEPEGEKGHYMGYLVLQSTDERNYSIIDGQQRMTTLSLLVLAVLKNLQRLVEENVDADDNKRRADELRKTYIGYLDPVTLSSRSKLSLNRHNNSYYQNYLAPLASPLPRRNLKQSETYMRKGFEWFEKRVWEWFGKGRSGMELAKFVDDFADRIFFTVISVTDELNAFKVFETLNARGVRLSSTDLLKNYLFSVVHRDGDHEYEMRKLEECWESVIGKLGSEKVPDFLRVFWNSRNSFVRHAELFKSIRKNINSKVEVFSLLRNMDQDADTYAALNDASDSIWSDGQKKHVRELNLFNIRQPHALLLAAHRTFGEQEFTRVLRACAIVSFRYNVIGTLPPREQEHLYSSIAVKIDRKQLPSAADVIRALRPVYTTDEQFGSAFEEKQFRTTNARNRQVMRYILFGIEKQASGTEYDFDSHKYNIEHILPEHPDDSGEGCSNFTDEQMEQFVYRIGNMTLLDAAENRDLGNKPYEIKRQAYERSRFQLTRRVAQEYGDWTPERIISNQKWLARQATAVWRLAELS